MSYAYEIELLLCNTGLINHCAYINEYIYTYIYMYIVDI